MFTPLMGRALTRGPAPEEARFPASTRTAVLALFLAVVTSPSAWAASEHHFYDAWHAPRAADFAQASQPLAPAVQALCVASPEGTEVALEKARAAWRDALLAWESLSAVALGPVLEGRYQRLIDFTPTRPAMIEKAIRSAPATLADMERIGTPAKGFPALEWLLWTRPVQPDSPACTYATRVAEELGREAAGLAQARLQVPVSLDERVNQWVGGLERLRWSDMEMPARVALTSSARLAPDYPRRASGAVASAWAVRWRALKFLATGPQSLVTALREKNQTAAAQALVAAVAQADAAMQAVAVEDFATVLAAGKALAALKAQVENQVAPALGVNIGFSDADGD
ncbi:MAG: imelysin family protein [Pseudomonadota bacterium]